MKKIFMPLIVAVGMLVLVGCESAQVKNAQAYATMANAKAALAEKLNMGNSVELELTDDGKVSKVVFNDSRIMEAKAQLLNVQAPETTAQTLIKAGASVVNNAINQAGAAAPVAGLTYLGKQIANMDRSSSVVTTTTTSGDTMGDNANNSGTMQTGDGRINSNDATATPTVVTQPAPVIVQPEVVKADVVQVSSDSRSQ